MNKVLANDVVRFSAFVFLIDRKRNRKIALKIAPLNLQADEAYDLAGQATKKDCGFNDSPADCLKVLNLNELLREDKLGAKEWEFMKEDEIEEFCSQLPTFFENETSFIEEGDNWSSYDNPQNDDNETI